MNERIKELAEQAEFEYSSQWTYWTAYEQNLERFAELVRQDEREACARLCDDLSEGLVGDDVDGAWGAGHCARAIEVRGDMFTKSQNVYTSEERVHENDKSISGEIERLKAEIKRANQLAEYRLKLLMQMPEHKPWVKLTDDEISTSVDVCEQDVKGEFLVEFARAIEAKLKERNT